MTNFFIMKHYFLCFILLLSISSSLFAQDKIDAKLDSMSIYIRDAFDLMENNKYGEAIMMSNSVLEFAIENNEEGLIAKTYNVLGNAYFYAKNDSLSYHYLYKSLNLYTKLKDTSGVILVYNNLGVNYRDSEQIEKSNENFERALKLARKLDNNSALIYPLYNVGYNLVDKQKKYKEALPYIMEALDVYNSTKELKGDVILAHIYETLSYIYFKLEDEKKSTMYYNRSIAYCKKHNFQVAIAELYRGSANLNAEKGDFEKAYELQSKFIIANDSIVSIKEFGKVKEIEAAYKIKENEEKLNFVKKEQAIQKEVIKKSKIYNILLVLFSLVLLFSGYWIYKKNKQLKLAKDKAENLSKVKSDFYSEISHELRTPLYAVIELSGLLLKENVSVKHKEYIESLRFSGNHLMSLINNVLELNKVESGKMKIQQIDFELKNLVSNIIESLEYALRDSNNTISFKYDENIPQSLTGDSLKVSQILINLISNAIKFTNNGHIEIEIDRLKDVEEDEVRLAFKIVDNGSGISEEMQSQVFEDFYQEHSKNGKSYKGTGLGLSIVKRLLVVMGSDINVISKENEGSTFFFELNFRVTEIDSLPIIIYKSQLEYIKNKNFLIVDDNKINQLVTRKVLDHLNIKSKAVDSGAKAIALIKEEEFDCVLMDINMPELDGYETTELIREFNRDVAIVALTAATKNEVEVKASMHGMDDYILKPFITKDFVETITKAMHRRQ